MNANKQRIYFSIEFGDALLPIVQCADGHDRVPLKPITRQFALNWRSQRKKIERGTYLHDLMGIQIITSPMLSYAMTGIRVDRVRSYLERLNTERMFVNGNVDGGLTMRTLQTQWGEALAQLYDVAPQRNAYFNGIASSTPSTTEIGLLCNLLKARSEAHSEDQGWLTHLIRRQLTRLGVPMQAVLA